MIISKLAVFAVSRGSHAFLVKQIKFFGFHFLCLVFVGLFTFFTGFRLSNYFFSLNFYLKFKNQSVEISCF